MVKPPKGGRGRSEYVSTHVRMPEPLVKQCLKMRDYYWEYIENGGDPDNPPNYLVEEPHIEDSLPKQSFDDQECYYLRPGQQLYNLAERLDPHSGTKDDLLT